MGRGEVSVETTDVPCGLEGRGSRKGAKTQRGGARRASGLRQRGRDYVWLGREGSHRGAEAQRDDTEVRCRPRRSVAPRCTHRYRYRTRLFDSVFPPPPSSARFMRSPYPRVRDCRTVERRRRRPPLHGLHGETRLPGHSHLDSAIVRHSAAESGSYAASASRISCST